MAMKLRLRIACVFALALACSGVLFAQSPTRSEQEKLFQAAVSAYEAGRFNEAVAPLEALVKQVPANFEVQELLGLVYAAQSQHARSNTHLSAAVRLNPNDV